MLPFPIPLSLYLALQHCALLFTSLLWLWQWRVLLKIVAVVVVAGSDVSSAINVVDVAADASFALSLPSAALSPSLFLLYTDMRSFCDCVLLSILLLFLLHVRIRSIWLKCCLCLRCCCCCCCGAFFSGCFTVYSYFSIFCFVLNFFCEPNHKVQINENKYCFVFVCFFLLLASNIYQHWPSNYNNLIEWQNLICYSC